MNSLQAHKLHKGIDAALPDPALLLSDHLKLCTSLSPFSLLNQHQSSSLGEQRGWWHSHLAHHGMQLHLCVGGRGGLKDAVRSKTCKHDCTSYILCKG